MDGGSLPATLGHRLAEHARNRPDAEAVVDGDVRLSFGELDHRVDALAGGLAATGVSAGERVLWAGRNSFRFLELLLAAGRLGAMCCPVNWRQSDAELAFVLEDLAPAVVVGGDEGLDADAYEALVASDTRLPNASPSDTQAAVLVAYTAAFSGRPSGAMISHRALLAQAAILAPLSGIDDHYRYLNCGPLFHLATLMTTVATFVAGGTNVFTPRANAEEICRLIAAERCTGAFLVGPTINQILDLNADGRYDISSLRTYPGKPEWNAMVTVDESAWARRPGGYGQTEVTGMLTFTAGGGTGAHGFPSSAAQIRIVDPEDVEVAVGETGELCARGPLVMNGYWNRPEENERRFRNGWYHTNDLARREADGSITFVGPKTRLIKSALENVYPAEVEACLVAHDAVREVAVIGEPDPQWTQRVVAVVAVHEGASVSAEELIEFCRDRIASYKKPRRVEFVDALPRADFVVDYDALDEQFGGGGYPGVGG